MLFSSFTIFTVINGMEEISLLILQFVHRVHNPLNVDENIGNILKLNYRTNCAVSQIT